MSVKIDLDTPQVVSDSQKLRDPGDRVGWIAGRPVLRTNDRISILEFIMTASIHSRLPSGNGCEGTRQSSRDGLVTFVRRMGPAVNGGGWLEMRGNHVDFLYREIGAVRDAIEDCIAGVHAAIYQLGHPLGFHIQIYAGRGPRLPAALTIRECDAQLKSLVHEYPEKFEPLR